MKAPTVHLSIATNAGNRIEIDYTPEEQYLTVEVFAPRGHSRAVVFAEVIDDARAVRGLGAITTRRAP